MTDLRAALHQLTGPPAALKLPAVRRRARQLARRRQTLAATTALLLTAGTAALALPGRDSATQVLPGPTAPAPAAQPPTPTPAPTPTTAPTPTPAPTSAPAAPSPLAPPSRLPEPAAPSPAATATPTAGRDVQVFFADPAGPCAGVIGVTRTVAEGDLASVAGAALRELLTGPTSTEQRTLGGDATVFGQLTAGLLRGVTVRDGVAYVDLDPAFGRINNIGASCSALWTMESLTSTLAQFPQITQAVYALDRDPLAFYDVMEWSARHR